MMGLERIADVNWSSRRTLLSLLVGAVILTAGAAILGIFAGGGDFLWRALGTVWSFVFVVATVAYVNRLATVGDAPVFVKLHLVVSLVSVFSFLAVFWLTPTPDLLERLAFACLVTLIGDFVIAFALLRGDPERRIRIAVRTAVWSTGAVVILTDVRVMGNIAGSPTLDQLTAVLGILAASACVVTVLFHKMAVKAVAVRAAPEAEPVPATRAPKPAAKSRRPVATTARKPLRAAPATKKASPKSSGSGRN